MEKNTHKLDRKQRAVRLGDISNFNITVMVPPIYREWFVLSTIIIQNVATGISYAYPSILSPAITYNSSDILVTRDEASWIAAAYSLSSPIGHIFIPCLMQMVGRRYTNMGINLLTLLGCIIIALAPNFTTLILGRAVQGIVDCKLFISNVLMAEYSHPRRRGIAITLKFAAVNSGLIICVGLSTVFTWRQIAWLHCIPSIVGMAFPFLWPESPSWLAYKRRYQDCQDAFEWLRGNYSESKKELRELLAAQRQLEKIRDTSCSFAGFIKAFRSRGFLRPFFILSILKCFNQFSGVFYLFAYITEIMTKITGDKTNALYFSIGLGFLKLFGSLLAAILVGRFKRRSLLFSTGSLSIFLLGLTCLFDYLNKNDVLVLPLLPAVMLISYTFAIHFVTPISGIATGELLPIEYKGVGLTSLGIVWAVLGSMALKLTSNLLTYIYIYGTFSLYLVLMSISLFILYFILPEAKDRTLQNIENKFLDINLTDVEEDNADISLIRNK